MLIDVHCHLDNDQYKDDLDKIIENARKAGVKKLIATGIDHDSNKFSLELAKKYDIIEAAVGRYPDDAMDQESGPHRTTVYDDIEFMRKHKNEFIAIGEIGLDLFHGKEIKKQIEAFRKLIGLSVELGKVIVIHSRKAERETLDVLDEFKKLDPDKVVLHCFSGKKSLVKEAIEKGYNFSIPANIVRAQNFQDLVKACPLKRLLTETDGPYLSPFKNPDGSFNRNEPENVKESIKVISKIKKITENECMNQIFMNYQRIFS